MSVKFVFPKNKLAAQLKTPGGLPVAEALAAAQANLAEIKPQCIEELRTLTEEAQACFDRFPEAFCADALRELYAIAARGIGAGTVSGVAAADTALVSLCDLIDNLATHRGWDKEAVSVHLRTLQLLVMCVGRDVSDAQTDVMLSGLKKVSAHYGRRPVKTAAG